MVIKRVLSEGHCVRKGSKFKRVEKYLDSRLMIMQSDIPCMTEEWFFHLEFFYEKKCPLFMRKSVPEASRNLGL